MRRKFKDALPQAEAAASITADAAAEQPALLAEVERLRVELADVLESAKAAAARADYWQRRAGELKQKLQEVQP